MNNDVGFTILDEEELSEEEREALQETLERMDAMEQEELEADQELADFLCSEIEVFNEESIRTKEALIESVVATRRQYQDEASSGMGRHSASFYAVLDGLLHEFNRRLSIQILPEPLNEWWSYSYSITSYGIKLSMDYYEWRHEHGGSFDCSKGETITIFEVPARMLTVSEYAAMNGVETVTVRQWIRRAKIRCAVKYGREWLVPELAEIPRDKGYKPCRYYWKATLTDLPEKLAYLNHFKNVCITQSENSKDSFLLEFNVFMPNVYSAWNDPDYDPEKAQEVLNEIPDARVSEDGKLIISAKARAELELYLIGNPVVHQFSAIYDSPTDLIAEYGGQYCAKHLTVWTE